MNAESSPRGLPISYISRRLALPTTPALVDLTRKRRPEVEHNVIDGFDELIDRFNALDAEDPLLSLMPRTSRLKGALAGRPLPPLSALTVADIRSGVDEAIPLMKMGQDMKVGKLEKTGENKAIAIGSASMDTNTMSLAIGISGHIIERSLFAHLHEQGIMGIDESWTKDDILFALEDCALLIQAEHLYADGPQPILFEFITRPNDTLPRGGLGWRKQEQVVQFLRDYINYSFEGKVFKHHEGAHYRMDGARLNATGYENGKRPTVNVDYTQLEDGIYPAGTKWTRLASDFFSSIDNQGKKVGLFTKVNE